MALTLLWILFWFIIALIVVGLFIIVFFWGRRTIKDNPDKALILILTGKHIDNVFKGELHVRNNKGISFKYNTNKFIFVPNKYEEIYHRNRRLLHLNKAGQLIASPFANEIEISTDEKSTLIYELCASHIGADGMKALKGMASFKLSIIIIAIIAFIIGGIAVYGYNQYQIRQTQQQIQPAQPTQQQKPTQQPIEVK